ncbi:hypothetical protein DFR34_103103 [Rivihabitans pingtungensis]|uniref:Uncharacterized protein n=1 Tax=Rivihabitans pingtungensis TaxID=1054498 RepID=A0A318KW14_9NEIS|nr:hypothetical protein DFR34_103103 [Rivihabitans pingtungensis]
MGLTGFFVDVCSAGDAFARGKVGNAPTKKQHIKKVAPPIGRQDRRQHASNTWTNL